MSSFQEEIKNIDDLERRLKRTGCAQPLRPFVLVSYAQSVDGSIATRERAPIALSGALSLELTHRLRAHCDALLVGIETVLTDDPSLTVRLIPGSSPRPIVLDTYLRILPTAKLLHQHAGPWIVAGHGHSLERARTLAGTGAGVLACDTVQSGRIDLRALMRLLVKRGIRSLMVEGGARVITSFIYSGIVDLFVITISPRFVGGLPVIDGGGVNADRPLRFRYACWERYGEDFVLWAAPGWGSK